MKINNKIIIKCIAAFMLSFLLLGCNETEPGLLMAGPVVVEGEISYDNATYDDASYDDENSSNSQNLVDEPEKISTIRVFVCGEVNSPGVYELESTARVCDALILAGDFTKDADTEYLNQAAELTDGQKLYVPSEEEVASGNFNHEDDSISDKSNDYSEDNSNSSNGLVNINIASASELKSLPGIGDVKAGAIVSFREEQGNFTSKEQIMQVDGIGLGLYDNIKDKICVGN